MRLSRHYFALFLPLLAIGCHSAPPTLQARAKAAVSITQGTLTLPGLQQPVSVLRDRWGVAHIYAKNQHDLFFAQGFVAASDRLFQMELWKRSGQGRLAEVLGRPALQRDIYARLMRYRGDMQAEYASYSPDAKEILENFTSGINAYIASRTESGGPGLPIEFQIAGFKPEPWKPEDCLNRMAAFSMMGNVISELQHAQAVAALGVNRATKLFDIDPPVPLDPVPGVDYSGLSPRLLSGLVGTDTRIEFPRNSLEGSNNWTVSGSLTQSGMPLLANDPHRVLAEPSLRYMIHLVAPGWDVVGAGEPALPGVAVGHNENIAWGFTIFGEDQEDLYVEELNPKEPLEYKTPQGWARFEVDRETFGIRGEPSEAVDLKFTPHGPVLWADSHRALALRWVGTEPGTNGYLGSLAIDRAQNWHDFLDAVPRWKVPTENLVYADRQGNIGEYSAGLAPLRKNWTGMLPVPDNGRYEWAGFVPYSALPHTYNPSAGFAASANQIMIPENYPYKIGYEWEPRFRFDRITQFLSQARDTKHKLTLQDMENLQSDFVSLPGLALKSLLRQAITDHPTPAEQMILNWDGSVTEGAAPALYEFWLQTLAPAVRNLVVPNSGNVDVHSFPPAMLRYLSHPTADVFGSNPRAGRNRVLRITLNSAAQRLAQLQGSDATRWSWGKLHTMTFRHSLDQLPGAKSVLDSGPIPRAGDDYTVGAAYFGSSFEVEAGASYKEIFDLSNWDSSLVINVPGQSGQPGSSHYSDLVPLWSSWHYFPLAFSQPAVEKVTTDKLVLQP
jgi:penicillin amidase